MIHRSHHLDALSDAFDQFPVVAILGPRQVGKTMLARQLMQSWPGSANVFLLPKLAESLAGRIEILPLEPLSQSEIAGKPGSLIDRLFAGKAWGSGKLADSCSPARINANCGPP